MSITITLPDGSQKTLPVNSTPYQVALTIGEKLAEATIGARFNGELIDAHQPLVIDGTLELVTAPRISKKGAVSYRDDAHKTDALFLLRHTTAHVMAEAIQALWPDTQLAYGPALDTGFYYDLALDTPISSDDFEKIETKMAEIVADKRPMTRIDLPLSSGFDWLRKEGNKYKLDNADRAHKNGAESLSWYFTGLPRQISPINSEESFFTISEIAPGMVFPKTENGGPDLANPQPETDGFSTIADANFADLCQGPHVDNTGRIGAFKVMSIASSHWHGDVESDRFQRVYGTAFFSEAELDQHLCQLEEARKRDHRVLGKKHHLFHIDEKVGQGLILWTPKGGIIRQELQNFIGSHLERQGYFHVFTPHIGKLDLYRTSGHYPYYADSQFPPLVEPDKLKALADEGCTCGDLSHMMNDGDIDGYMLKPMNCPHHIRIYASEKRSYRDLPLRLAEFGTVYRWEQSGELGGMTRVRGFTQDDAHLFVTPDQLEKEVTGCLELVKIVFETLGLSDYRVRVGLRDPDSDKYVGESADWDAAEAACRKGAESLGVPYVAEEGEAAFYGPKIDFVVKDCVGREWQLGTVQVDYQLPQRFELAYTGSDNAEHPPVMIHRAPFGSMERFVGVLIEHFAAAFPLWLSPEQVRVMAISDKFNDYADEVYDLLRKQNIRATRDTGNDRIGGKIRQAQDDKVNYMWVVGGKDRDARTVSIRHRSEGEIGAISLDTAIQTLCQERDNRDLDCAFETKNN